MASLNNIRGESRPTISNSSVDNRYISKYERDITDKLHRAYHKDMGPTIFDLPINEILGNTAEFIDTFQQGYSLKIHKVQSEYKLYNEDSGSFLENIKKYLMAFLLYLGDDDNMLYFGILMVTLSIILYFLNISSSS